MTKLELAYCAGVIDSDGTIGIRIRLRHRSANSPPTYSERISVKQVEPSAIDLLHRLFGGSRYMQDPNAKRGKPLYSWDITDKKAIACITALLPYLRIKKRQGLNCLALRVIKKESMKARWMRAHGSLGVRPLSITERMHAAYLVAKGLNHAGV